MIVRAAYISVMGAAAMDDMTQESLRLTDTAEIRAILSAVCELTGMGFAAVARVTDTRWIACQVLDKIDFGLEPGAELDLKTTICNEIRDSGHPVVIDHVSAEPAWRTHHTPMLYGFESYVSLPIILADGSLFGTLCAIDPAPRRLSAGDMVATMRGFATQVATILNTRKEALATDAPGSADHVEPLAAPDRGQARQ
jgi:GAF domain-containing protein